MQQRIAGVVATVRTLLDEGPSAAPAIVDDQGTTLAFGRLRDQVDGVAETLRRAGLGRGSRIALLLVPGVPSAVGFLAATSVGSAAPLNPALTVADIEFNLDELGAQAVIVSPELVPLLDQVNSGAMRFLLHCGHSCSLERRTMPVPTQADRGAPTTLEEALVLHTSGTTARPKMVPLSHANLVASVGNIRRSLALTPDDRSLCVMPLFHIHGLMAGLLAPLAAGASVIAPAGFDAFRFHGLLDRFHPTYYSAVPTMHQLVLKRAPRARTTAPLRFVRSSSSPLSPATGESLESYFNVPAVEAYGMTEAAHQICINPLPPGERRPGSVGPGAGVAVTVLDAEGEPVASGSRGEVAIRGLNVMAGYWGNPEANAAAFSNGWFRTGDEGSLDEDGYLALTGRIKEIINRAGEKISPREIDEILLRHAAVEQAVAFAIPDALLGEDIGLAVVLREGGAMSESEIKRYVRDRVAIHKVPRTVLIVDEIPKGATGKVQRVGLAARLGLG